ncbi:MAG: HAD-IA family hydrolase, partial [Candidatus Omnitrophica bacterium]|nr:HAD-IA family hydrolase [Candidatus Omnitrophota bacterium]
PLPQEKLDALCQKFHDIVVDRVVNSSFVNGAKELLEYCEGKYDMFVASGTPQGEIRDIVQQRTDIAHYFKGVYGSPDKKAQIIQNILESKNLKAEEVIFIGDSHNDLEGAKTQALHFIARYYDEDQTWLKDPAINAKFPDMMPVMTYLENLNTKEQVYK